MSSNASVRFKIVLPQQNSAVPVNSASIRASAQASTITFKLIISDILSVNGNTFTFTKIVPVNAEGTASATFYNLPQGPAVADISLNNANIQGYTSFKGAKDLTEGENFIEVAPTGSHLLQEITANTALYAFKNFVIDSNFISKIQQNILSLDFTAPDIYTKAINKIVKGYSYNPIILSIDATTKSIAGYKNYIGGSPLWIKNVSDYFTSGDLWNCNIDNIIPYNILKEPGMLNGYVGFKHTNLSTFAIAKIATNGKKIAFVKNPGVCNQFLELPDKSVIIGGINEDKHLPVIFKWFGDTNASTYSVNEKENNLDWCKYISGHLQDATIENLSFNDYESVSVTVTNPQREYIISIKDGSIIASTTIELNNYPSVTITSPNTYLTYYDNSPITFTAIASDTDGSITQISFCSGTQILAIVATEPYSIAISLATGTYYITAKAKDDKEAISSSKPVTLVVHPAN